MARYLRRSRKFPEVSGSRRHVVRRLPSRPNRAALGALASVVLTLGLAGAAVPALAGDDDDPTQDVAAQDAEATPVAEDAAAQDAESAQGADATDGTTDSPVTAGTESIDESDPEDPAWGTPVEAVGDGAQDSEAEPGGHRTAASTSQSAAFAPMSIENNGECGPGESYLEAPGSPMAGFELDGNFCVDGAGGGTKDWSTVDPQRADDQLNDGTQFTGGASENSWNTWDSSNYIGDGTASGKSDIGRVYVHSEQIAGNFYGFLGLERSPGSTQGSVAYYLELNAKQNASGPKPDRSAGDLRLKIRQNGNDPIFLQQVHRWSADGTAGSWESVWSDPTGDSQPTGFSAGFNRGPITNLNGIELSLGSFMEIGINLTALFSEFSVDTCSGGFEVLNLRSSSSPQNENASLGDYIEPLDVSVPSTCSSVQVDKNWVIDGETFDDGSQPAGFAAALELTGQSAPEFGTSYDTHSDSTEYRSGDAVTIGEQVTSIPDGCTNVGSGDIGTKTLEPGANHFEITNTVTCTRLTLIKKVIGNAAPTEWTLNAHAYKDPAISGATGSPAVTNAIVEPGTYRVWESDGPDRYDLTSLECTKPLNDDRVTLEQGDHVTCTFTNTEEPPPVPVCSAGYVYALGTNGQMQQVDPSGNVTDFGESASGSGEFNGLGIGANGMSVFAYQRSDDAESATIWEFDTNDGTWSSTSKSIDSHTNSRTVDFVAGAVNLDTGEYMFGGFGTQRVERQGRDYSRTVFRIWSYDPGGGGPIDYKGYIATSDWGEATDWNNGDMAFDSSGNLFIVRGDGGTTTVFSVTAENLQAANGGEITAAQSASVETMEDVNGVAFDADGRAYLGAETIVRSYGMPDWDGEQPAGTVSESTDLASCSSPVTVTLEKYVDGNRVNPDDQFELTLNGPGGSEIGSTVTTGNSSGVQEERVGPLPVTRSAILTFNETFTNDNASSYATSYQCRAVDSGSWEDGVFITSGNATAGSITVPTTGEQIICRFVNASLVAGVTIHKDVTDFYGADAQPREGWTVGAAVAATTGSATIDPTGQLSTGEDGNASWTVKFGTPSARATVSVSEQQQAGYEFLSGSCVVTKLDGTEQETTLTGPDATGLTGVAPGDSIDCTYVNRPVLGSVTWNKVSANENPLSGSEWSLTGPGADGTVLTIADCVEEAATDCEGPDVDPTAGGFEIDGLVWGEYTLVETKAPPGYQLDTSPRTFTISAATLHKQFGDIINDQQAGPDLPLTGGIGRDQIYIAGALVLLLSLSTYGATKLHRRRSTRSFS